MPGTVRPRRSRVARLLWKYAAPFVGLALVLAFFELYLGIRHDPDALLRVRYEPSNFLTPLNLKFVAAQTVYIAVCAIGMTFIMIGGGIDLSVGSVMALCCVICALMIKAGYSVPVSVIVTLAVGAGIGLVNGLLITRLRIIPFVVTLGMMLIARGLAKALADNKQVRLDRIPESLTNFPMAIQSDAWWDFAPSVWMMLALAVVGSVLLNMTRFGRRTFATGANEMAARFSGIRVNRQKCLLYTMGGLLTAVSGVVVFGSIGIGDPTVAQGAELTVIAAVVVGGGSLLGGEGSVLGTIIGAFMLSFLVNGCTLANFPNYVQDIVIGAIIVLAVALDYFRRKAPQ